VIRGVQEVEAAQTDAQLAQKLTQLFAPIAPTLCVLPSRGKYSLPAELQPKNSADLKVTYWRHHGVGISAQSVYRSERVQDSVEKPDGKDSPAPGSPWRTDLGGVQAWIPMALFVDGQGTLPHAPVPAEGAKENKPLYSDDNRAVRLADVIIAWNVFEHFYPYFDLTKTDWSAVLPRSLEAAATDNDAAAFKNTLSRLVAELHDGHGAILKVSTMGILPLEWDWIEGKLVITAAGKSAEGLARGDLITLIDGRPSSQVVAEREALISGATPQWIRFLALYVLRAGTLGKPVRLTIETFAEPGKTKEVSVKYEPAANAVGEARPEKIAELEKGIFYVDISRITNADFDAALPQLEKARGIVFDFRGYPSNLSPPFLTHLSSHNLTSAQWHIPLVLWPDRQQMKFEREGEWNLQPATPLLTAKMAFITDGRAISRAESYMGIVEAYKLGAIVGAPTAGTNGNVNPFTLPGGYRVAWTGLKVLKHDGSRHHGVGIAPTVPVSRTRAGVAAGHDEFLDQAVKVVKE